ncbi:MAG: 50S ribosomal protein L11 methyltransferase [Oscillospiraceae bacterium]|nr:50S ribosomal protein L11 methyltransferase [Oscillospiraceae bacterium]
MDFIKLDIYTASHDLEPLADRLTALGVSGFEFHDAADFEEFLHSGLGAWDYIGEELEPLKTQETRLSLYVTTDKQGEQLLAKIYKACADLRIEKSLVRETDWADAWKEHFKPFEVGRKFLIKPTWEETPGDVADKIVLEIDPASAFGTGQHESTKLCLEALEEVISADCNFLDIGCGSGILSIAALLLGAAKATMTDVSETAVRTACENILQNGFTSEKFAAHCGDIIGDGELLKRVAGDYKTYDVITANIVADVIIKMSEIFPLLLSSNGVLIASGIIGIRLDEVLTALKNAGLKVTQIRNNNDWWAVMAIDN